MNELSKNTKISMKTPVGITEEREIEETIMQGESVSSILCTTSVDKLADENLVDKYRYMKSIEVPTLGFVDDLLDIKKCGEEAKESNDYL